ncbi:uncharacterized protein LOC120440020 [Scomber scombrus]|uniref:Uncharacterized protein LOC120440020 n=1 Tax=Scomber scombrus TaxID=13677 RepID=A0AAV1NVJ8_SCOSC
MVSSDSAYGSSAEDGQTPSTFPYNEDLMQKTILVGDSGVGKTSLLVQFDQGKFITGSFSATVGIGFTVILCDSLFFFTDPVYDRAPPVADESAIGAVDPLQLFGEDVSLKR